MASRRNKKQAEYFFDYTLLFIVLFLLGFGMIMVYSTSSYEASLSASLKYDEAYYLKHQALAAVMGLVAMIVVANIPYHFWERFAVLGYFVSAILIALVLTPLGIEANGARRWRSIWKPASPGTTPSSPGSVLRWSCCSTSSIALPTRCIATTTPAPV